VQKLSHCFEHKVQPLFTPPYLTLELWYPQHHKLVDLSDVGESGVFVGQVTGRDTSQWPYWDGELVVDMRGMRSSMMDEVSLSGKENLVLCSQNSPCKKLLRVDFIGLSGVDRCG
jgi:hypothetical protein